MAKPKQVGRKQWMAYQEMALKIIFLGQLRSHNLGKKMLWHSNFTKFSICKGSLWVLNISLEIHKVRKHKGSKTACHIVSTTKKKKNKGGFIFNNPLHLKTYEKPLRPVVWMKANKMVYVLPSIKSSLQEQVRGEINLKLYGSMDALVHAPLQWSWHLASCPAAAALQGTLGSRMHPTQLHIPKKFPISDELSVMTAPPWGSPILHLL